jgi:aryl-alcohol dehydrogenase-like predicted oxidoreductase
MGPAGKGLSKTYIRAAVEASLRRLQTDYIDLYQAHIDDPTTPLEETLQAFGELVREGKIRWIGASNYNAARLKKALAVSDQLRLPRFESVQPRYNLYDRAAYEAELELVCNEEGLGVITYFSLASGFLSGKYRTVAELEGNRRGMWLKEYFSPRGLRILEVLRDVATQQRATPAQVALAWVMARPGVTAPIASATSLDQLAELVASARLHLDDTVLEALDAASAL